MSYAILHMQKLKQPAIKGIQIHNQREKESQTNPDIDESKQHLNYDLVNPEPIDYNEKVNSMIKEGVTTGKAIRKDAVKVAGFLVTSDSEFFESLSKDDEKRFFKTAYEYFCEEYGKDNIAYAMVHKDEKTPHMHVGFVPLTEDGRLSAKDFFGKKQQLVQLQDKFHDYLAKAGFDLERGVSSDRKHIETARYKAETIKQELSELEKEKEQIRLKLKKVEDIPFRDIPEQPLIMMYKKDFEELKKSAKVGIDAQEIKRENKVILRRNFILNSQVEGLQQENNDLKTKYEDLKDKYDLVLDRATRYIKHLRQYIENLVQKEKLPKIVIGFMSNFHKVFLEAESKKNNIQEKNSLEEQKEPIEKKKQKGDDMELER